MKNLLRASLVLLSVAVVAGCASQNTAQPAINKVCPISGKEVPADGPSVDYQGKKIGFCCDKCPPKWNAMDEAAKKAAVAAMPSK